ncbi:hypothetical protein X777_14635 [Ooceraea biroi]|uniref:Uncharacterized protein n=1 Tax=Ooceraea biroi TaxID=2015173 RepID=A0A026WZR9_OOCBI|nr:hypothetical protein X777_14635 [Ooceraea biroi]
MKTAFYVKLEKRDAVEHVSPGRRQFTVREFSVPRDNGKLIVCPRSTTNWNRLACLGLCPLRVGRHGVIPADRRPPEKEETWTLAADQQDPCVCFDDTVDSKTKESQDFEKMQLKSAEVSADVADTVDASSNLPRSQETRKSKTKKVKNYLRKCKGALSKGDESVTEKKRQENCTSWYLEDVSTCTSHQEARDEPAEKYTEFPEGRFENSVRELVENPSTETLEGNQVSCSENLESTPDVALARLLEEDRRADLSRSRTSLYEDARTTSPEPQPSPEKKTPTKESKFHDEETKNVTVSLETLTTGDTNLDKCDSNDTLIAEAPEAAETASTELTIITAEESKSKELIDAADEEATLPVPAFCAVSFIHKLQYIKFMIK